MQRVGRGSRVAVGIVAVVAMVALSGGRVVRSVAAGDPVIAAAGDIACDPTDSDFKGGAGTSHSCQQMATSDLINSDSSISAVLALGDNQYGCGGLAAYQKSFGPSWGRFLSKIHPTPGNHEYQKSGGSSCDSSGHAQGYFSYFGVSATGDSDGDYAWDIGAWHMIELNGNCSKAGGCGAGSHQATFLQQNLGASKCTLAYWHQPYYSGTSPSSSYKTFWQTLYAGGADIVLNGHQHSYARFAPQNASGAVDATNGVREFIVGTGGDDLFSLPGTKNVQFTTKKFGVLKLTLHATSYDWKFVAKGGSTADSGTAACH